MQNYLQTSKKCSTFARHFNRRHEYAEKKCEHAILIEGMNMPRKKANTPF